MFLLLLGSAVAAESDPGRGEFRDAFLDNLVGDWHVERKFGNGRTAENTLRAEWVLGHHFIELHYLDVATPPKYEAMVFVGFDKAQQCYVSHWIDVFGGQFSAFGRGKIDNAKRAIEFTFDYRDGPTYEQVQLRSCNENVDLADASAGERRMETFRRG